MNDPMEEFAQMALELHANGSVTETVDRVLEYALKAVSCDYAGVVFMHGKSRVETTAATHPLVSDLGKLQLECGEGPNLDVLEDRFGLIVADTREETRWPTWARAIADVGIRSMLSVRLYTSSTTIGSLNLYDEEPRKFDVADQEIAHVLARHAAVALSAARQTENLWQAIDSRKLVGQAQGILMERFDLNGDQAFAVLARYSQDKNIKLRAVAEMLVETRNLPQ